MTEKKKNRINFSFPNVHPNAKLSIEFQRTLRIPVDDKKYPMPPSHGSYPLQSVLDSRQNLPDKWKQNGGVMLPVYQSEALWISFHPEIDKSRDVAYPFAVKISFGRTNAITGQTRSAGLCRAPQNYLVVPNQPWLDGYYAGEQVARQFVGLPYDQENVNDDNATIGIEVYPLRGDVFEKRFPRIVQENKRKFEEEGPIEWWNADVIGTGVDMGVMPGGCLKQEIARDTFGFEEWDKTNVKKCQVYLANTNVWKKITGHLPPTEPPDERAYQRAGLPWMSSYEDERKVIEAAGKKKNIIKKLFRIKLEKREQKVKVLAH
jgi:hypothetical protein